MVSYGVFWPAAMWSIKMSLKKIEDKKYMANQMWFTQSVANEVS